MSVVERLFVKWQTRSLGLRADRMMDLLPVCICIAGEEWLEKSIQNIRRIVFRHIRPKRLAVCVFRRIMMKTRKYFLNQEVFEENKHRVFEVITQNIQMFSLVLDAFDGIPDKLEEVTEIIKDNYEKEFVLSLESKRLLEYQERRYFVDEQNKID